MRRRGKRFHWRKQRWTGWNLMDQWGSTSHYSWSVYACIWSLYHLKAIVLVYVGINIYQHQSININIKRWVIDLVLVCIGINIYQQVFLVTIHCLKIFWMEKRKGPISRAGLGHFNQLQGGGDDHHGGGGGCLGRCLHLQEKEEGEEKVDAPNPRNIFWARTKYLFKATSFATACVVFQVAYFSNASYF